MWQRFARPPEPLTVIPISDKLQGSIGLNGPSHLAMNEIQAEQLP